MSTENVVADDHAPTSHVTDDHEHEPTARTYWLTFVFLVIVTAIEVAWSYTGLEGLALVAPLIVMMIAKFIVVAGVFMHLQIDLGIVNGYWFTVAFGTALALAVAVYMVVFAAFEFQI